MDNARLKFLRKNKHKPQSSKILHNEFTWPFMVPHPTQNITYCRVSLLYPHSARYLTHFGLFFRGSNFLVFLFPRLYVDKAHICPLIIIYCTIIEIITNIRLDGDVSLLFQMVFFFFYTFFAFFNFSIFQISSFLLIHPIHRKAPKILSSLSPLHWSSSSNQPNQ